MTWKMVGRLFMSIRNIFSRWVEKLASEKALKSTTRCVKNWTHVGNTKEKIFLLIWNWEKINKNELIIIVT